MVVTQDIDVVFGTAIAVHGAGNDAEMTEVTFVSAAGCKLSTLTDADMSVYLYSNSRLTLAADMSTDKSEKSIRKFGDGELVFDLKAANASMRSVYINSGATFKVLETKTENYSEGTRVWGRVADNAWICLKTNNDDYCVKQ